MAAGGIAAGGIAAGGIAASGGRFERLPIFGTVHEALGLAGARYETALRLAWLPLLLLLLFQFGMPYLLASAFSGQAMLPGAVTAEAAREAAGRGVMSVPYGPMAAELLTQLVSFFLLASFVVPLLLADTGRAPLTHRSLHLAFGPRQMIFVLASLLTVAGVVVANMPLVAGTNALAAIISDLASQQVARFDEGSLHAIDTVPLVGQSDLEAFWQAHQVLVLASLAPVVYLGLRLLPLPYFAAAKTKGDGMRVFADSFAVTAGFNWVRLLFVLLLLFGVQWLLTRLLLLIPLAFGVAVAGIVRFLSGITALSRGGEPAGWIQGMTEIATTGFAALFFVAIGAFVGALIAGLGGSLVRRFAP